MMDTTMERSSFIQAFQRQLDAEMMRNRRQSRPVPTQTRVTAEQVKLRDGTAVSVRPIQPDDIDLLWAMHRRLSNDSLYYRFLRVYQPTMADLAQICNIGDEDGGALVVTTGRLFKKIVAVAYYLKYKQQPDTAEPAMLVEDRFQGRGLGQILWQRLVQQAQAEGINTFEAYVHSDNGTMLHLIQKSGLPVTGELAYDLYEIQVQLKSPETGLFTPVDRDIARFETPGFSSGGTWL
jgi:RimJ/RimL family protein N-acetyltransferase